MDQSQAPLVSALAALEARPVVGFGAPGHGQGHAMPRGARALLGKRVFRADVLTPKGLDDRTEGSLAVQRAHEVAAEAWGADLARYVTGGSTQSLHTVMAALARPGDTVLIVANSHKAEFAGAMTMGLNAVPLRPEIATEWDVEHGVAPQTLAAALDAHPDAKAAIIVSPTYYGVTSDIAGLAAVAHARGVPLVVDAAWGAAFGFSPRLPANPLAQGADVMVCSVHKTLGALAQGSVLLARGNLVDQERIALAYELFETTSPSVPIMASLDTTRRDHATGGAKLWGDLLDKAEEARAEIAEIPGARVLGREHLEGPGAMELDESKITVDIARWGVSGYAVDDWLFANHRLSIGLSDARHVLAIAGLGTSRSDFKHLSRGLAELLGKLRKDPSTLPAVPNIPRLGALGLPDMAMPSPEAFFAKAEKVELEKLEGRIAAEIIAPAPPGVPRLLPGQRITAAHVAWLVAQRDAGAFFLDPADPTEHTVRVVA